MLLHGQPRGPSVGFREGEKAPDLEPKRSERLEFAICQGLFWRIHKRGFGALGRAVNTSDHDTPQPARGRNKIVVSTVHAEQCDDPVSPVSYRYAPALSLVAFLMVSRCAG